MGLPPNEVPAVEIARGDLVEVTPASYGVMTRAFHFWSGEGRGDSTGRNLYENFAEATSGKGTVLPDSGVNFAADVQNMESEAAEEQAKDQELKAGIAKTALRRRMSSKDDGARSAPTAGQIPLSEKTLRRLKEAEDEAEEKADTVPDLKSEDGQAGDAFEEVITGEESEEKGELRGRSSECSRAIIFHRADWVRCQ